MKCILLCSFLLATTTQAASPQKVYELRTYHTNLGKLPALQKRFREHTHSIFERLNMKVVAYWIPTTSPESSNTLIYILEHDSEEDAKQKWQTFITDPTWVKAYQASIKDGALVDSIDVVFMQTTDFSPVL
ncbi:NIPSNAP family protein [uncultured Paraglaciecola sp.]|uniref:NIPSNAP family protein n=1 Tax=uncultured Paraglaciecola sp. TaxID=1765024 RepID=UPI0030DD3D58|tara:strand:- start:65995 stop:66387 length:393 start_codon:yes stop_codon:yes gene_type:complete